VIGVIGSVLLVTQMIQTNYLARQRRATVTSVSCAPWGSGLCATSIIRCPNTNVWEISWVSPETSWVLLESNRIAAEHKTNGVFWSLIGNQWGRTRTL